jgi:transposase
LSENDHALYDISSSYYEGNKCLLAKYGYNRDGKRGKKIIVYGILTNREGCPVSLEVYPGNTADPKTVLDQVEKLKKQFGLNNVVLVGDRGMLTHTQIEHLKQYEGIGWISALRYEDIRKLLEHKELQLSIFDHQNIAEIQSKDFPGERLIVCYNPLMNDHRLKKREALLQATETELEKVRVQVQRRRKKILDKAAIALKAGKVLNKYKMQKHFILKIEDGGFEYSKNEQSIKNETMIDGFYVIRTNQPKEILGAGDVVRSYKGLSKVERLFQTLKGMNIKVRPIRHWLEQRVSAHIFICMLAYYLEWHMRKILASLIFDDEELENNRMIRDAVAPAECSDSAKRKKTKHVTADGLPVQSFSSLLDHLATRTWNTCVIKDFEQKNNANRKQRSFIQISDMTPLQAKVFELIRSVPSTV